MKIFLRNTLCSITLFFCINHSANSQVLTTNNGTTSFGSAGIICLGDFLDPLNLNTPSMADWVDFRLAAGIGCSYWIHSSLNAVADPGSYAGFHVRSLGLLSLLSGVEVRTYLSGQWQETASGAGLLSLLAGDEGDIYFTTTKPYNEVRLVVSSLLGLAYNINIFYGFGSRDLPETIILPVSIRDFQAIRSFDQVQVSCFIDGNVQPTSVMLEKSIDGRNFMQVGRDLVQANVNPSQSGNSYQFRVQENESAFYRVKVITDAGSYYSRIIAVPALLVTEKMQVISMGSQAYLIVPAGTASQFNVALYDLSGRIFLNQRYNLQGRSQISLPANLARGNVYVVALCSDNGQTQTKKFVL